eukprot:3671822-Rhodomonas_salina.1
MATASRAASVAPTAGAQTACARAGVCEWERGGCGAPVRPRQGSHRPRPESVRVRRPSLELPSAV